MYYLGFLIIFLIGIGGLYLGIVGYKQYTNITRTTERVSALQIIKIATRLGISSSLVFFVIIFFGGVLDDVYVWSLQKLWGNAIVSSILGFIVILGGAYQIYTTVVFRDMLIRKNKEKDK